MNRTAWPTAVTRIEKNMIAVRGYPIEELIGSISFPAAVYLLFKGELPDRSIVRLLDALLVASIDHGTTSPSALTARTIASTGADVQLAATGGLLAISRLHGPVTDAMTLLRATVERYRSGISMRVAAEALVDEYRGRGVRVAGFGHRLHDQDPRVERLFVIAAESGVDGPYVAAAREVELALRKRSNKVIPMNLDGAIAAVLCELDFPVELGNPLFTIARYVGLCAQAHEEKARMRPMRKIGPQDFEYDGPPLRHLDRKVAP